MKKIIGLFRKAEGRIKNFLAKAVVEPAVANNSGMGVVEIILIIVVLISLVLIFKTQLTALVNNIFTTINNNASAI